MAFPVLGAGSGGFDAARALALMHEALEAEAGALDVTLVRFASGGKLA